MRMFRFPAYAFLIGVCVFFSLRCEKTFLPVDSSEKIDYLQGNTEAQVIFKLFDNYTLAPIEGVKVAIVGFDSALSDMTGTVIFDSIHIGSYMVACTKTGFESCYTGFDLTLDSNSTTVPIVKQSVDMFRLARKGAVVKGKVYYENEGKIYTANKATVECVLTHPEGSMFQYPVQVTTSSKGDYTFANLPEYTGYTIKVHPFINGSYSYKQEAPLAIAGRSIGDTLQADDIMLDKFHDGKLIVMSHNLESFTQNQSIEITFSEAIDIDKLADDSIYVSIVVPAELVETEIRVLVQQEWKDENTTLVITPFDGAWDTRLDYTLRIRKIVSVTGKPFENVKFIPYAFSPSITGSLNKVKNIQLVTGLNDTNKVDYNTTDITLLWSPLNNAASYQVYYKASEDSLWINLESTSDTSIDVPTDDMFNLGKKIDFMVLGKNSTNISSMEAATVFSVYDKIAPRIDGTITIAQYLAEEFDNSAFLSTRTIPVPIGSSFLPEPMDTTKSPVVSRVTEAGTDFDGDMSYKIDRNDCYWEWTSEQAGIMHFVVDPQKNGSYDSLVIKFTDLTDLAGNKADTTNGAGYLYLFPQP